VRAVGIAREAQLDPLEVANDTNLLNPGLGALLGQVGVQAHPEHDKARAEENNPDNKAGDFQTCHDFGLHCRPTPGLFRCPTVVPRVA
jgi:hypothetical protein